MEFVIAVVRINGTLLGLGIPLITNIYKVGNTYSTQNSTLPIFGCKHGSLRKTVKRPAEDMTHFGNESFKISFGWFLSLFWDRKNKCLLLPLLVSFILLLESSSVYPERAC